MRTVKAMLGRVVVVALFFASETVACAAANAEVVPVLLQASFEHTPTAGPAYSTSIRGSVNFAFQSASPTTARAEILVPRSGCEQLIGWDVQTSPPDQTQRAVLCLASASATDETVNAWVNGKRTEDPSLGIDLVAPSQPNSWMNPAAVAARLFLRGCGDDDYRRLGEMTIAAQALVLQQSAEPGGAPRYDLSAASATLHDVDPAVWSAVLAGCGGAAAGLPTVPENGTSMDFAGTSQHTPPDPSQPHVQIAAIADLVEGLAAQQRLSASQARSLVKKLERSTTFLQRARPDKAIRKLERFESAVQRLVGKSILSSQEAGPLITLATNAGQTIGVIAGGAPRPLADPLEYCGPDPGIVTCSENLCAYTTYYVKPLAKAGVPDGSPEHPYPTMADALARADALDLCAVELRLGGRGAYEEDVSLTRKTRIRGEGRTTITGAIENLGPYELVLQDIFLNADGIGVNANHPCATTSLINVHIQFAERFGVLQVGGALEMRSSSVFRTHSEAGSVNFGTGIAVACGAHGVLDEVQTTDNAAAGLQVVGDGTVVEATELDVLGNETHPAVADDACATETIPPGTGAVQIRGGGDLTATLFYFAANQLVGVLVAGDGSHAELRQGTITATDQLACNLGGLNAVATAGGHLEVRHNFRVSHAALAGLMVHDAGEIDLQDGYVSDNVIGVNVQTEVFDIARLQDGVSYEDNDLNLDSFALPVPQSADGL